MRALAPVTLLLSEPSPRSINASFARLDACVAVGRVPILVPNSKEPRYSACGFLQAKSSLRGYLRRTVWETEMASSKSSASRGRDFEDIVYGCLRIALESKALGLLPGSCKLFRRKRYYSIDRAA